MYWVCLEGVGGYFEVSKSFKIKSTYQNSRYISLYDFGEVNDRGSLTGEPLLFSMFSLPPTSNQPSLVPPSLTMVPPRPPSLPPRLSDLTPKILATETSFMFMDNRLLLLVTPRISNL